MQLLRYVPTSFSDAAKIAASGALFLAAACTAVGPKVADAPAHHRAKGFANPNGKHGTSSVDFVIDRTRLALLPTESSPVVALPPDEAEALWDKSGTRNAVQWLGHASVRIRLAGEIILVDPVLSEIISPAPPFGPVRATRPPIRAEKLADPDAILITHNHYDHFEVQSVRDLAAKGTACLMPLGVASNHRTGCATTEMDWHEARKIGAVRATLMPAQHDSARGLLNRDRALWGAWLLEGAGRRIYVSGDTGYGPHFSQARRAGLIDMAILNVGGYKPRRLNKNVHMNPEEAVRAFQDLGARRALIVHWGTYGGGLETGRETYDRVRAAADAAGLPPDAIRFLQIGGVLSL